jgi:hypothetical protein
MRQFYGQTADMNEPTEMNRRNWDERAAIHARDRTGDYMLDRFRADEDARVRTDVAVCGWRAADSLVLLGASHKRIVRHERSYLIGASGCQPSTASITKKPTT